MIASHSSALNQNVCGTFVWYLGDYATHLFNNSERCDSFKVRVSRTSRPTELLHFPTQSWSMRNPSALHAGFAPPFGLGTYLLDAFARAPLLHRSAPIIWPCLPQLKQTTSALPNSIRVAADLSVAGFCQGITEALSISTASSIVDDTFPKRACRAGLFRIPFRNVGNLMCSVFIGPTLIDADSERISCT